MTPRVRNTTQITIQTHIDRHPRDQSINIMMDKKNKGPRPGTPSPLRGRPSPLKGRSFPERWITGPDPVRRRRHRRFILARNQAHYRKEEWHLSFEQYENAVRGRDHLMGRGMRDLSLTTRDPGLGWRQDNVELMPRHEIYAKRRPRGKQQP